MLQDQLYDVFAANATHHLTRMFPAFEDGTIATMLHVHAYLAFFRQLGVCRLLTSGTPEALFVAQQQAASGYLFRLASLEPDDQVTSIAGVFWDAIGGQYWAAAHELSERARPTWNPKREHEEDFLYVRFLMKRYFLGADHAEQETMLTRWDEVLEGALSPRLDLCQALLEGRNDDVVEELADLGTARATDIDRKVEKGTLMPDLAAWMRPYSNEALALIRLAEHEGIEVPPMIAHVPDIVRIPCPYRYSPQSFRHVDFRPSHLSVS